MYLAAHLGASRKPVFSSWTSTGLIDSSSSSSSYSSPRLRDSNLLAIDNGLASCFVHKTGYSSNQSNIQINYVPSSSPVFEYYDHIKKFRYTSHTPSSVALNFTLDASPFRYYLPEKTKAAFFDYFKLALIEFAGCSTAWNDPDSKELQELWVKVMPSEMKGQYSQFSGVVSEMVRRISLLNGLL